MSRCEVYLGLVLVFLLTLQSTTKKNNEIEWRNEQATDRITELSGQPSDANFAQYSGYIIVDNNASRALFYQRYKGHIKLQSLEMLKLRRQFGTRLRIQEEKLISIVTKRNVFTVDNIWNQREVLKFPNGY